jgi:hypothetical protein
VINTSSPGLKHKLFPQEILSLTYIAFLGTRSLICAWVVDGFEVRASDIDKCDIDPLRSCRSITPFPVVIVLTQAFTILRVSSFVKYEWVASAIFAFSLYSLTPTSPSVFTTLKSIYQALASHIILTQREVICCSLGLRGYVPHRFNYIRNAALALKT